MLRNQSVGFKYNRLLYPIAMVENPQHVATGVKAVCESAMSINRDVGNDIDLWVDPDELTTAVEAAKKLTGQKWVTARLYGDKVCIEL